MNKGVKVTLLVVFVLLIDQCLKIWVKTSMHYGEEIYLLGLDWARLHFVENNGMAFGISLGGSYGKLALSVFRIIAVFGLGYYINLLIKAKASMGLLCSFALILAGALGNILDSAFYGLIFSASTMHHPALATMFPEGGGYAGFLYGKVVDMLYFPMFEGHFPSWFPFWGGEYFLFFKPVFNIADIAITSGVFSIILFHRGFFSNPEIAIGDENPKSATILKTQSNESTTPTTKEDIANTNQDTAIQTPKTDSEI